jgi:hypothetical protein
MRLSPTWGRQGRASVGTLVLVLVGALVISGSVVGPALGQGPERRQGREERREHERERREHERERRRSAAGGHIHPMATMRRRQSSIPPQHRRQALISFSTFAKGWCACGPCAQEPLAGSVPV